MDKLFGNNKDPDYRNIIGKILKSFQVLSCLMYLKIHFLQSHLDYFFENLEVVSEEQGEGIHQDINKMERRYQGNLSVTMMTDYCWMLQRDIPDATHKTYKEEPLLISQQVNRYSKFVFCRPK